ncbi:tripartite tricarboxylate transporter substrate-binding protein [Tardiphaga sp.]|uniref:Bug family tripartite tricarboxylate transporter substrate binding protein n=1 Tax=Tardiphaga sp. TaxID=1926292 RepID=UPI00262CEDC3|nr:tripartite tricarboxylate transporter substrate-binding protein [Tardiphaga sp.]
MDASSVWQAFMTMTRGFSRRLAAFSLIFGAALLSWSMTPAQAQSNFPTRPIRVIVPFAAGGVADITMRIVAESLGDKLGQRLIIENMPGAGGVAAARAVLSSTPDGYTLALLSNGTAVSVPLFKSLPYDPVKNFAPISSIGFFDFVVGTNVESPYKTLADLIKFARENPGKLNVGTISVGSTQNLSAALLKSVAGVDFQIVPYRGTPEVIVGLLRKDIDVMIDNYVGMKSALLDQKITAIGATGETRSVILKDVPTLLEGGVNGYDVVSWNALFAPSGTPPEVIAKLNAALREVLVLPDVKQKLLDLGIEARASSPEELKARLVDDIAKWTKVIDQAGIPKQ